jgi:hypothetical protein
MPTTFSTTQKNNIIGWLAGSTTPAIAQATYYAVPYNGVQPADPLTTPAGSAAFSSYSVGIQLGTYMSFAGGSISQLSANRGANASSSVSALSFARIYGSTGTALMDTPVSLSGGGGGLILDNLSSTAGVALNCTGFSIKFPKTNGGTLFLNQALSDRLVDNMTALSTTPPQFGINTAGASSISIYSGTPPADADSPATGTLLATWTIGSTQVFNTPAGGSASLTGALTSAAAAATGTATYARWTKTNGSATFVIQGSVGTSGADFLINTTSIVSGNTYTITDATLSI